ncbi:MAG: hypothetical protein ACRELT_01400, partial [Longimicrobiales bacterium]
MTIGAGSAWRKFSRDAAEWRASLGARTVLGASPLRNSRRAKPATRLLQANSSRLRTDFGAAATWCDCTSGTVVRSITAEEGSHGQTDGGRGASRAGNGGGRRDCG